GKGVLDERHPLSLGSNLRLEAARSFAENADVLLVVGSKLREAELWAPRLEATGAVIRIDISAAQLQGNLPADVAFHGQAAAVLAGTLDAGRERTAEPRDLCALRWAITGESVSTAPGPVARAARIADGIPADAVVA